MARLRLIEEMEERTAERDELATELLMSSVHGRRLPRGADARAVVAEVRALADAMLDTPEDPRLTAARGALRIILAEVDPTAAVADDDLAAEAIAAVERLAARLARIDALMATMDVDWWTFSKGQIVAARDGVPYEPAASELPIEAPAPEAAPAPVAEAPPFSPCTCGLGETCINCMPF